MPHPRRLQKDGKLQCASCKEWLVVDDFYTHGSGSYFEGGKRPHSNCKKCHIKKSIERQYRHWDRMDVAAAKRKSIKLGTYSTLTTSEWRTVVELHKFYCYLCGVKLTTEMNQKNTITLDHVVPFNRGGVNTKENVLPACSRCNTAKRDMTLDEFVSVAKKWSEVKV
jgi:5-methylcytosine-specific restriction endonuclease McrA